MYTFFYISKKSIFLLFCLEELLQKSEKISPRKAFSFFTHQKSLPKKSIDKYTFPCSENTFFACAAKILCKMHKERIKKHHYILWCFLPYFSV